MEYGLAVSGGGTRGAAHVGVLKALEEASLLPGAIAGTSAGSIVAGLYASGMLVSEMEKAVKHLSRNGNSYLDPDYGGMLELMPSLLAGKPPGLSGLIKGDKLLAYFRDLTRGIHLDEAVVKLVIPAVDLISADTVCFTNLEDTKPLPDVRWEWDACLCEAMMASSSVPAVFAPRRMRGRLLVDGGVTDNLPGNLLRAAGVRQVVGVDIGSSYKAPEDDSITEVVSHSFSIMSRRIKECGTSKEMLVLKPVLGSKAGLLTFNMMEECMDEGYRYTKKIIPLIYEILSD